MLTDDYAGVCPVSVIDRTYMVQDFALRCYDSEWWKYFPFGIVMILVYPVVSWITHSLRSIASCRSTHP